MLQELPGLREASVSQRGNRLVIEGYGLEPAAMLAEELVRDYGVPRGWRFRICFIYRQRANLGLPVP